jgi:class 3 adenylate cyclase
LGTVALTLLQFPVFHAALSVLEKPLPVVPLLGAVAFAGLLPEYFRHRARTEPTGLSHPEVAPTEQSRPGDFQPLSAETDDTAPSNDASVEQQPDPALCDDAAPSIPATPVLEEPAVPALLEPIDSASAQIVMAAVVQEKSPSTLVESLPEARREECTVMHCELSNHAMLVRALPPAAFTTLMNQVLTVFETMVAARGGLCDRLGSEGMRAFFRSSEGTSAHAETALQCALALRARLESISQKCEVQSGYELDLRLGINSGEVVVAAFGSPSKCVLSVAGEPAEWAVRLAGANLLYGSKILLGARTSACAFECVETRPIDLLQRQLPPEPPEEVFELLASRGSLTAEAIERLVRYREGVDHFRARRWREAGAALRAARPPRQDDDAIDLLLHRISEQEALAAYVSEGH